MDKYIEREAAIKMAKPYWQTDEDGFGVEWLFNKEPIIFKKDVEAIPAADVAPIIHAQWIEKYWTTEDDWGVFNHHTLTCSACAEEYQWSRGKTNYCPNCGARMDGGRE